MKKTLAILCMCGTVILATVASGMAVDVEKTVSLESISTQSVGNDDLISPYYVTGESLVQLMQKMANFNVAGSNIVFNRKTAQIFVRNTPSNHDLIAKLLADLRRAQFQQVEIEARIITVSSTDIDDLGLDFLGVDVLDTAKGKTFGTDTGFNDGTYTTNVDFPNVADSAGNNVGGQLAVAALGPKFSIDAFIDALKSRAEVNTLSAPHLIVANNQRANIRIERAAYYVQSIATDANSTSLAVNPEVGIAQSGTILDVTPTINADGTLSLEMHPQFVTADLSTTRTINVSDDLDETLQPAVTLPIFTIQNADTTVTIENGGVALIGGLIEEQETKGNYKVPVLGDIPLLGKLCFQSNQVQELKKHLVIFVKATVKDVHKSL